MYDNKTRVRMVKARMLEKRRVREKRQLRCLSALCISLFALLAAAVVTAAGQPSQAATQGMPGAMLLRKIAGGYVLAAFLSFSAAAALIVLWVRRREKQSCGKSAANNIAP